MSLSPNVVETDFFKKLRLEKVNSEKQKAAKETYTQKLKKLKPKFTLILD